MTERVIIEGTLRRLDGQQPLPGPEPDPRPTPDPPDNRPDPVPDPPGDRPDPPSPTTPPVTGSEIWVSPTGGGNGSPGNPTTLKAAWTASRNSAGKTIRLGPGTYNVAPHDLLRNNRTVSVVGSGKDATKIVKTGSWSNRAVFDMRGGAYFTLSDLTIDAKWMGRGIWNNGAGDIDVSDCHFTRCTSHAVGAFKCQSLSVDDCTFDSLVGVHNGAIGDAHCVVSEDVPDVRVSDSQGNRFTGDFYQLERGRSKKVLVTDCIAKNDPLTEAPPGFDSGVNSLIGKRVGENMIDTKNDLMGDRVDVTLKNLKAYGFRNTRIGNASAYNLKEGVNVVAENCLAQDCSIAYRIRGMSGGRIRGPVLITGGQITDCDFALRVENGPGISQVDSLEVDGVEFGPTPGMVIVFVPGRSKFPVEIDNCTFHLPSLPPEAPANQGNVLI